MNATVKAVDGDTLVLAIAAAPLARRLSEQRNTDVIATALRDVLGVAWRIRCEHDGGAAGSRAGTANPGGNGGAAAPTAGSSSRQPPARRPAARPAPQDPPPPEPPPDDEEEMLAEAAAKGAGEPSSRRDPEEVAIELLTAQLGARAVDDR